MPSRDVQILRNFTQKLAGQTKQANPLTDPKVLSMLGTGAVTGLGAYGLARAMQSDEDRERGSYMPLLAGLAGAGAGAYGGSYLPQLLAKSPTVNKIEAAIKAQGIGNQSISGVDSEEPHYVDGVLADSVPNAAMTRAQNMPAPELPRNPITNQPIQAPKPEAKAAPGDYRPPGF